MSAARTASALAERRWTARSRNIVVRCLGWMSLRHAWAWRVRLDLIVAFNLALAAFHFLLTLGVGPAIVSAGRGTTTTDEYELPGYNFDLAATVLLFLGGAAALAAGLYWSFAVTKSVRLRELPRLGGKPGILTASTVLLSFAFWALLGGVRPYLDMPRHPVTGNHLGIFIARANSEERMFREYDYPEADTQQELVLRTIPAPSVAVPGAAFRPASLWRSILFDSRLPTWYSDLNYYYYDRGYYYSGDEDLLREGLLRFRTGRERGSLALLAHRAAASLLDNPHLPSTFLASDAFDRFVRMSMLFAPLPASAKGAFPDLNGATHRRSASPEESFSKQLADWQASTRQNLMETRKYADALAAVEAAMATSGPAPPVLSAAGWDVVCKARAKFFDTDSLTPGDIQQLTNRVDTHRRSGFGTARYATDVSAQDLARWRAHEADPGARARFQSSPVYTWWKNVLLHTLVYEGAFTQEIKQVEPYPALVEMWTRSLRRSLLGPELVLMLDLRTKAALYIFVGVFAALALAMFVVSLNRVYMNDALPALVVSAVISLTVLVAYLALAAYIPASDAPALTLATVIAAVAILAPIALLTLDMLRRRRTRGVRMLALAAIWTALPWVPIGLSVLFGGDALWPNYVAKGIFLLAATILIVVPFAALVHAMVARVSVYPRPG